MVRLRAPASRATAVIGPETRLQCTSTIATAHTAIVSLSLSTFLVFVHIVVVCGVRVEHGSGPSTGRVGSVGSGRVQIFSLLSGLGRVGSICVGLYESPWIIHNVTLSVIVKFTRFSELLVLLKLFSV